MTMIVMRMKTLVALLTIDWDKEREENVAGEDLQGIARHVENLANFLSATEMRKNDISVKLVS